MKLMEWTKVQVPLGFLRCHWKRLLSVRAQNSLGFLGSGVFDQSEGLFCNVADSHGIRIGPCSLNQGIVGMIRTRVTKDVAGSNQDRLFRDQYDLPYRPP